MKDPYQGTWTLDLGSARVWDDVSKQHVPDEVGGEVITMTIVDGVQTFEVLYGDSPKIRMGYRAAYDGPDWVPYTVTEIQAVSGDVAAEVQEFKKRIKNDAGDRERQFEVGKPYGLVRVVTVDRLTQYRVNKAPADGTAQSIVMRRMEPDESSFMTTVLDVHGIAYRLRKFLRA